MPQRMCRTSIARAGKCRARTADTISNVGAFDRAQLTYVGPSLTIQSNLGEIIEEISFVVVPEPTCAALVSCGMLVLLGRCRGARANRAAQ